MKLKKILIYVNNIDPNIFFKIVIYVKTMLILS
jgi:hypothetical protein